MHPDVALVCAALGALGGWFVPVLVGRIPEPDPDPDPEPEPEPAPEPDTEAGTEAEPKELYGDIAALPGLAWKSALAAAACAGLVGLVLGWTWELLFLIPLVPVSVALAVVDWRTRLLPTRVIAPTYVVLIALVLACWLVTRDTDDLVRAGWGWLISGGLFLVLWLIHPRGMGYGDVRLSGVLGIALGYVGWGPLLLGVYGGFLLGGVGGGLLSVLKVVERKAFPFGPFMLVGALIGVVFGESLSSYLVPGLD